MILKIALWFSFLFFIVQIALLSTIFFKMNASSAEAPSTEPEKIERFSPAEYTGNRKNPVSVSRNNENAVSVENFTPFKKESIFGFEKENLGLMLRVLRKGNISNGNEEQNNRIRYKNIKKIERSKREVGNRTQRAISSLITLQTTDSTIRVDYSRDLSEQDLHHYSGDLPEQQDLRQVECRFITNDNRRLIENLVDTINCGNFPLIDNGHFELFLGDLDDSIEPRIKCDRYYIRQGPINGDLVCLDGKWQLDARCEKVRCKQKLEIPLNGQDISSTGNQFNDTATFSCLYGYKLIGNQQMRCGEDGNWIGKLPTCKLVQCPTVTAPENGSLSGDFEINFNQTFFIQPDFNTTITYRCDVGYTLVGKSKWTCQADGTWSHRKRPQCKKVCLVPFSKRLASTVWLQPYMNPLNVRTEFQFGQIIIYLCRKRFKSINDGGAMCIDGKWDPPIQCHRIHSCKEPLSPKNGRIADRLNRVFIQFACDYGYQISGSETQRCLRNGTWSGTTPKCNKMCQMPQVFAMDNAWLSLEFKKSQFDNKILVGSTIEYSCKNGYQKATDMPSTCDDGNWIPKLSCLSNIVRVTGSTEKNEGLVEIYINGTWGLVCDHLFVNFGLWGENESKVVCRMLGYASGIKQPAANYKRITKHITYQSVTCSGNEQNILRCNTMSAKIWCNRFIAVKCFNRTMEF